MNPEMHAWLNSFSVFVTLLSLIWFAAVKHTRIEVKVDTMWGMLLKRAVVDGVHAGLMEVHSPIRLVNDSGKMLEHMACELREFYQVKCKGLNETEAALAIENEYGARLAKEICIPNGISFGICIIIALMIAKDVDSLTEILDQNLPEKKDEPPPATTATPEPAIE